MMVSRLKKSGKEGQHKLVNLRLDLTAFHGAALPRCRNRLGLQLAVRDGLAALHDAHNGRLRLVLSVALDVLVRRPVLFLGLLELDLIDFDSILDVGKRQVDLEAVGRVDVSAFGSLGQDSVFGTGE